MEEPKLEFKIENYYTLKPFRPELISEPNEIDAVMTCFMLSKFAIKEDIYKQLPVGMKQFFEPDEFNPS